MNKILTNQEETGLLMEILNASIAFDCIGDKNNDYCGKITSDELVNLAKEGIIKLKKDKHTLNSFEFNPDWLMNYEFSEQKIKDCALKLAKENNISVF